MEDVAITPVVREETVSSGSGSVEKLSTPSTSRCPSRSSNKTSVDGSDVDDIDDDGTIASGEDKEDYEGCIPA